MKQLQIPCQVYGKQLGAARSSCYHVIVSAAELDEYQVRITQELNFQWLCLPARQQEPYRDVWYFLALDEQRGLLCQFQDAGADPRPHVLRRTVGLLQRAHHADFLAELQSIKPSQLSGDVSAEGIWSVHIEESEGIEGKASAPPPFDWRTSLLQAGSPETYSLTRLRESSASSTRQTGRIKRAITTIFTSPTLRPYLTHILCLIIGILLSLFLISSGSGDAPSAPTAAAAPTSRVVLQHERDDDLTSRELARLSQRVGQLHALQRALGDMREAMQRDVESFYREYREYLSPGQRRQVETLKETLHPRHSK